MCLFDTGKKLQNKEDLKEMGDGNCCFQKHMCFLSSVKRLFLVSNSSFGEMHELTVVLFQCTF